MILKNLRKKLNLVKFIFSYKNVKSITEEEKTRGIIVSELGKLLKIENIEQHFQINAIADSIVSRIFNKTPIEDHLKETVDGAFHQQMWYFSIVAGYAALWEFKVKLLAQHLGIEIKEEPQKRSKHHIKNRTLTNRDLKFIISDIEKKLSRNFDLKLTNLNGLRSSLVHGNFDQLRILANNCRHTYKKSHQGNVFVFSLDRPESGTNLSKNLPKETKEQQSHFSWFLEVTNSQLLKEIWQILDESIMAMNCIVDFGAYSFDGREEIFQKVVIRGEKLTPEMMEKYSEIIMTTSPLKTVDAYFGRLRSLFGNNIFSQNLGK